MTVGDIIGEINYLGSTKDGCSPWFVTYSIVTNMRSNFEHAPIRITIHDLRDKEKTVNLDTNGFEVAEYDGFLQDEFELGSESQQTYFEEVSNILKKRLGASRVIIYNYTFRSRGIPVSDDQCDATHRNPVTYPHVDINPFGVEGLIENELGKEDSEKAKQHRIQIINVWRPLGINPITEKPLTLCDYNSTDTAQDVHPLTIRGGGYHSTAYTLSRNAKDSHKWYYLSNMRSNEMFLIKIFDSKPDVAEFAFHTSFKIPNEPVPNVEQKSLEVRCLVFYDE